MKVKKTSILFYILTIFFIACSLVMIAVITALIIFSTYIYPVNQLGDLIKLERLLLFFLVYPVGLIIVWIFTDLSKWLKFLLGLPVVLFTLFIVGFISFMLIGWKHGNEESTKIKKISGICDAQCKDFLYEENHACFNKCTKNHGIPDYKRRYGIPAEVLTATPVLYQ